MNTTETTMCEHGVSHQPGPVAVGGRSIWCGECFFQCECGVLVYVDTESIPLPYRIRNTDGTLHTCWSK